MGKDLKYIFEKQTDIFPRKLKLCLISNDPLQQLICLCYCSQKAKLRI